MFAFAAAALVFLVRAHPGRRTLALLVVSACVLAIGVRGRSLDRSLAGRAYLWKISAAHLLDAPWVGNGPGSFAVLWPAWEAEQVAAEGEERSFFGRQEHAHDDFLEWLLELGGPVGLLRIALVGLALGLAIGAAREGRSPPRSPRPPSRSRCARAPTFLFTGRLNYVCSSS